MLAKGFLRHLSDWSVEHLNNAANSEFDKVAIEFGIPDITKEEDYMKVSGLFSEWVVFDANIVAFDGGSGLDYFLKHNPTNRSPEEMSSYQALKNNLCGFFSVEKVQPGSFVILTDANNNQYEVHDINLSLTAKPKQTIWTRIANINDYHCVGSVCIELAIRPTPQAKALTFANPDKEDYFDAKAIAELMFIKKMFLYHHLFLHPNP